MSSVERQKERMACGADHVIEALRLHLADTDMLPDYRALLERHVLEIENLQQRCMEDIGMSKETV